MSSLLPPALLTLRTSLMARQRAIPIPLNYSDSANWLWSTHHDVFKMARFQPTQNIFWQGAYTVFGLNRYRLAQRLPAIAGRLPKRLPMQVVPMDWFGQLNGAPIWRQTRITGRPMHWSGDNAYRIGCLCHLLQQHRSTRFGHYLLPANSLGRWASHLYRFLFPRLHLLPEEVQLDVLASLRDAPTVESAIPLMLDLRQDQFLIAEDGVFWVDWEAMVWAPLAFAWALYEVLIPRDFRADFMAGMADAQRPDLQPYRLAARAYLYLTGTFGHTEWSHMNRIDHWLDDWI
ncbi:hypothetical protein [Cernens ardua]|uniref:hypothetical protein n=1 Tax=Cernens ardua TaxID=3402176 RepID=UPI003F9A9FE1